MTNRHPSKVKNILSSGIDSLVISINSIWKDKSLFTYLEELKEKAKQNGDDYQGQLKHFLPDKVWPFTIKPHGTKGFSWILTGGDFTFKIANSIEPGSRPSLMIEFRQEALWRLGPEVVIKIATGIVEVNGGEIIEAKLSRVDLCLDFIMPEERWSLKLLEYAVSRGTGDSTHRRYKKLTGFTFGQGKVIARLYDKPTEIKQKSKKVWMYDVWKIKEVPEKKKIIRIEFELHREVLKESGLNKIDDLFKKINGAWAYCTKDWLKFQGRPGLHHTQRKTFKWYQEIQDGFNGVQGAEPLVREKAVKADKKRSIQQAIGQVGSVLAINQEENNEDRNKRIKIQDIIDTFSAEVKTLYLSPSELQERNAKKRSKYHREKPIHEEGQKVYKLTRVH